MNELSEAQKNFIPHLLHHCDPKLAAQYTGMDEATIHKWMRDPVFKEEMRWRRRQIAERAIDMISNGVVDALKKLQNIIADGSEAQSLKAAISYVDFFLKGLDQRDIKDRMEAIESKLEDRKCN